MPYGIIAFPYIGMYVSMRICDIVCYLIPTYWFFRFFFIWFSSSNHAILCVYELHILCQGGKGIWKWLLIVAFL